MALPPEADDQYKVPLIAKLLHSLPHFNITFHRINSTFKPRTELYLESLGILGAVPIALLIISLFGLLLYLMTRCCDRKPRPAHSITSLKVTLSIVTVLCCAAIGLGLYGNDDLHNGLLEVLQAGKKVDNLVSSVRNQTNTLEQTLTMKIRPQLVELADIFDRPISNQTALQQLLNALNVVQGNVTLATNAAGDIRRPLMGISMNSFLTKGDQYELIRWPGTVAVLALLLVLCAVLLVGVARHSRCALILFSVCGLLAVTGSWLMSGLYLSTSVAVGDLCIDPANFLVSEAPNELPVDVLLYYTQCESVRSNPFTQRLRESQNSINNARNAMTIVSRISLILFRSAELHPKLGAVTADLNTSERLLTGLTALVDCKLVHFNYLIATRGLCEGGLLGLVLMLIASFIAAILLTVMVWVDSHTWIYIRKRNDYAQVEEQSYISTQQAQNHQTMSRTLPRQMNNNGPPVISGSHTMQHPRNKHENMPPPHHHHPHHQYQNMRGTHTLGRLPSHNQSPTHIIGPNNAACSEQHYIVHPQQQQQQQQHLQQQQQQQLQQQQQAHSHPHPQPPHSHPQQQPTYYHTLQLNKHHRQIYQQQQMQAQQLHAQHQQQQLNQPPLPQHQQQLQQQPIQQIIDPNLAAQLRTLPIANGNNNIYVSRAQIQQNSIPVTEANRVESSNPPHQHQMYKTLPKPDTKPAIFNCPLPAIPKTEAPPEKPNEYPTNTRTLPHNKRIMTGKAIPLPKILPPTENELENTQKRMMEPPKAPVPGVPAATTPTVASQLPPPPAQHAQHAQHQHQQLPPPPIQHPPPPEEAKKPVPTVATTVAAEPNNKLMNMIDESNNDFYAVTEL